MQLERAEAEQLRLGMEPAMAGDASARSPLRSS